MLNLKLLGINLMKNIRRLRLQFKNCEIKNTFINDIKEYFISILFILISSTNILTINILPHTNS